VRRRARVGSKALLLALIALAGAIALIGSTQTWVTISLSQGAAAFSSLVITGQKLNSSLSPVAIAALACALALTIAGPVFRRMLGVLAALLGAGLATLGAIALADSTAASAASIGEATGILGDAQAELVSSVNVTAWPAITIVAGALLVIAGAAVLVLGGRWRSGGRKYQSAALSAKEPSAGDDPVERDRISDWDAMNSGQDPTRDS